MRHARINIQPKHVALALAALILIASAAIAGMEYELRHMAISLQGFDVFADQFAATVSVVTLHVPPCASDIEHGPNGDPRQEATLAYVASIVDLYRTTFGRLPQSVGDLKKLPSFANADKLNGNEMKKSCLIEPMPSNGAYVLACGGKLPSATKLKSVLGKTTAERFVVLDGAEVLYVPSLGGCV
jgi:hypothetical protein